MQLAQVEAFVEVALRQNLTRAAEALFVSQPALSARLAALERELGAQLFVRTGRGMRLTDPGKAFLYYAQRSLASIDEGREAVSELVRGAGGRLDLGAAPIVSTYVLPAMLRRFREQQPTVDVSVRTGHSEEILQLVLREQVQVGLVRALAHPEIESSPLYEERLVLVVEPGHELARRREIGVADLAVEQLLLFDRTSSYHELTSAFFREAGVVPRGAMELDSFEATKKMVEQGLGVALLPSTAVTRELRDGTLVSVRIVDAPEVRRRVVAIWRRDLGVPPGPAADFLAMPVESPAAAARARGRAGGRRAPAGARARS